MISRPTLVTLVLLAAATANAQQHWSRTLGGEAEDGGEAVALLADGVLVGAGSTRSHSTDREGWLFELDASGTPGWELRIGGSGDDSFFGVTVITDGSLIAVGERDDGSGPMPWLVGVRADGSERWQVALSGGSGRLEAVAPTADGGVVAVGWFRQAGASATIPLAIKVSAAGVIVWERAAWPDGSWTRGRFESVSVDAAGRTRVAGRISPSQFGRVSDGLVVELDDGGELIESSQLVSPLLLNHLLAMPDGGLLVFGDEGAAARLDPTGAVAWTTRPLADSARMAGAGVLSDGSLVLAGNGFSAQWFDGMADVIHDDLVLIKLSDSGALQWTRARGGALSDSAAGLVVTASDDLVLVGTTTPFDWQADTEAWALRLDDSGQVSGCGELRAPAVEASPTFPLEPSPRALSLTSSLLSPSNPSGVVPVDSFGATPCYDCEQDVYEPNDRCVSAGALLPDGGSQLHGFCDDADDWILIDTQAPSAGRPPVPRAGPREGLSVR